MPDIWLDVDTAVTVPVNILALIDDTDFKSRELSIAYNEAGMDLVWNFVTSAGVITQTAVTPTTGGVYDWTHAGDGMYNIEIPASGGGSINNDTEGYGWFTGLCTGVLPWRGPVVGFRAAGLNDLLCDDPYSATRGLTGTALPAVAAGGAGGLPISDAGGLDMDAILSYAVSAAAWGSINSGTIFRGSVSADDPGVSFTIGGLAGQGAGAFVDANTPWYAYVFRDAGGAAAAPQGEVRKVTAYTSATGLFATDAFTVPVATGDDVMIVSAALINSLAIKTRVELALPNAAPDAAGGLPTGLANADLQKIIQQSTNRPTWYVKTPGGNDGNSGTTKGDPFLTLGAALSAASSGDWIKFDGAFTEQVDLVTTHTLTGITLEGTSPAQASITVSGAGQHAVIVNNGCRLLNFSATATGTMSRAISAEGVSNIVLQNVIADGVYDGAVLALCTNVYGNLCRFSGDYDGVNINGTQNFFIENSHISTDCSIAGINTVRAVYAAQTTGVDPEGRFRNCHLKAARTDNRADGRTSAIEMATGGKVVLEDCILDVSSTHASHLGRIIGGFVPAGSLLVKGGQVTTSNANPADDGFDFDNTGGGTIWIFGAYDPAKVTGTVVDATADHLTDIKGTGFAKDTHSLTDVLTDVTGLNGDAMRGTDSAALAATALSTAVWTAARAGALADWIDGGRLDNLLDAVSTHDAAAVVTAMEADGSKLDHLWEMTEDDGGVRRLTTNSLEQAPSAGTNPNVLVDTTAATVVSQTELTLTAGSDDDDAYNDQAVVIYDVSESNYPSVRKITDYTGATKTVILDSAPDFTMVVGDGVKIFVTAPGTTAPTAAQVADAVCDEALADHTGAGSVGEALADAGSLTVLPLVSQADGSGRLSATYLTAYQYTKIEATLSITDAAGDPVDLSGLSLALVAWLKDTPEASPSPIVMLTDGPGPELTIGGANNDQVTIDGGTAHTATAAQYDWRLYDLDNDRPLATGTLKVEEGAAMPS